MNDSLQPGSKPDDELLRRWKQGEAAAGEELLVRYFDLLYRFFRSKLQGPIDDLIQGTLLAAVEAKDAFRGDSSFKAFLLGIARRQLLRSLRSRYRASKVFDPSQDSVVAKAADTSASKKIGRRDDRRLLMAALRLIPLDLQIVVELYYWEELSIKETAAACGIAPGTVKSRLARARRLLQGAMETIGATDAQQETARLGLERWASDVRDMLSP